ncbi:MAG: cupin domain-containing protein [Bacteroidales bacterium]|jgi:quercetin dioxygenase-like cupin family protein
MITRKQNVKPRQFKGVSFDVLAVGEKSMVTKMNYKIGDKVPPHAHPNEQSGYVISGKYRINYLEFDETLNSGDSYSIPENVVHSWEVFESGEVIDVFTPPRLDYL